MCASNFKLNKKRRLLKEAGKLNEKQQFNKIIPQYKKYRAFKIAFKGCYEDLKSTFEFNLDTHFLETQMDDFTNEIVDTKFLIKKLVGKLEQLSDNDIKLKLREIVKLNKLNKLMKEKL